MLTPSPSNPTVGAVDGRLDRACELVAVSACRLWPAQWDTLDRLTEGRLADIVGNVRERWGRLVAAAATMRADLPYTPAGSRWEAWCPGDDLDRLCSLSGWARADLEPLAAWSDPEGDPAVIAALAARIDTRSRWRSLVPAAGAVLAAVDAGRRPPADAVAALAEAVAA